GVKLFPCTVTSTVLPEFARADAGLMEETLGVVNPTVKSLFRLLRSVMTIVLPPGETVYPTGNGVRLYLPGGRSRNMNVPASSLAVVAWTGPDKPNATLGTPMFCPLIPVFGSRTVPTITKLCCGGGTKSGAAGLVSLSARAVLSDRPSRPTAVTGLSDRINMKPFP